MPQNAVPPLKCLPRSRKASGARGLTAEVRPVKTAASPAGWDAVILGSAVRFGGWLPEMLDFVKKIRQAL